MEAEEQPDIAESFDVDAVPSFVILRGHSLLGRISGADAPALKSQLEKYVSSRASFKPLSHTDQSPAAPPSSVYSQPDETSTESPEDLEKRLRGLLNQSKVVLFMKGSPDAPRCGFSRKMVNLLREQNVTFTHFDILTDESVRQGITPSWTSFPECN